ncbi:MAG: flippase [Candidatus Moraniibacteriota bacterium]
MLAKKIAFNVVTNSLVKILSTVLALVSLGMVTRYLGADGFGDYAVTLTFFALFNALGDLGLANTLTREISRENADEKHLIGRIFTLRLGISFLVLLITPILLFFLPYTLEVKQGIFLTSLAFVFSSAYQLLNGVFQKHLTLYKVSFIELAGKVLQVFLIGLGTMLHWGFLFIVSSLLFYMIFNFFLVLWFAHRIVPFKLDYDVHFWKKFLHESLPVGITAIITFAYFKTDTLLLSFFKTNTEVGFYNVAYKIIENLTFFPALLIGLLLPIFSRFIFTDREKFTITADKTFKVFLVCLLPLLLGGISLAPKIILLIAGAGFADSIPLLRILLLALAGIFFGNFFNAVLLAGNQQKRLMWALGGVAISNIIINSFLIWRFSYWGAAFTTCLTELSVALIGWYLTQKYLHYTPRWLAFWKILAASVVMTIILWFLQNQSIFLLLPLGIGSYIFFLWLFRAIDADEITSLFAERMTFRSKKFPL